MQKVCLVAVLIFSFALPLTGAIRPWTKLSLDFAGPSTSETTSPNPFTDYRMDVVFTGPTGATYRVPGYYAADGKAAETSATSGNVWRVNFTPDAPGKWTYAVSFVKGSMIAAEPTGGESAGYFDGARGKFRVKKPDGRRGKLVYTGAHYLQFAGNGKYFLKSGTNSPEVFLEYNGFDNTPSDRTYPEHLSDWQPGDLTWQGGKGKGIVGAVNYLANQGVNAYYFLTMNAYGDGKKAWPWTHADSLLRYDCSKLAQWDLLFRYMNQKELVLDLVLTETENEVYFEERELGGPEGFARSRKIYFREMVARFGYLPAVTWNVGEENGWHKDLPYQTANTDRQRKDYADYLRQLLYYDDHVTIHNGPSWDKRIFAPLYGHPSYTGPAFQWNLSKNIYREVYTLRAKSAAASHKWVVFFDEPYLGKPRADLDDWRVANVWPAFMAGGAGVALYMGGGKDIKEQDFRPYAAHYRTMTIARKFFTEHISFAEMSPDSSFVEDAHTLRKGEATFLLYFPAYEGQDINLPPGK
ncbi:MAG: DUF5060 domain-containing protein, partial [Bacteroidota bacterium]